MNEYTYLMWLKALIDGTPVPGEYVPATDPMHVMTGEG